MREHMGLFRGKRIDNGEWVEGFYIAHLNAAHYIIPCRTGGYAAMDDSFYVHRWYEVDPDTVGECTSLRDKNGKLIFEGDIFRSDSTLMIVATGAVHYADGGWCVNNDFLQAFMWGGEVRGEIIGNVHDNPELLKGGEVDGD